MWNWIYIWLVFFYDTREHMDEITQLHGKKETAFDYEKAPRRGKLENIRDFTHKKMYMKYYDDPKNPQPDTV